MTLFWLAAAILTAIVVAVLVSPLLRRPLPNASRSSYDLEVYRDQLAEVDRDLERGVVNPDQAEAARAEIARRILAVGETGSPAGGTPSGDRAPPQPKRITALVLLVTIPGTALVLYLMVGRPDLPAQPLAGRDSQPAASTAPANIAAAVAHLAERLNREPDDLEGWTLLAQSLAKLDRPAEAVDAWRHALTLAKDDPDLQAGLADALMTTNQGVVPDEARRLFEAILIKRPADPQASHFLALAQAQGGDFRGALDRWTALATASPADAPWLPMVQRAIADMARRLNLDPAKAIPESLLPRVAIDAGTPPPPPDRKQIIRSMVDDLATRLAAEPADVTGWLRLARAYQVLGEPDHQLDAVSHAKAQAPTRPDVLVAYAEALIDNGSPAAGTRLPPAAVGALRAALTAAPETPEALWYLGLDAAAAGQPTEAKTLWQKLLDELDPTSPDYAEVKTRLKSLN